MAAERFGSKTDVVVKLVLVFFIALLSFSIGTFVGKKFSDNQYKMAQLEPQDSHGSAVAGHDGEGHGENAGEEGRSIASISPDAHDVKPEKALTDDEIAKLAEEFVMEDGPAKAGGIENPLNDHKVEGHGAEQAHDDHAEKADHAEEVAHAPAKAAPVAAAPIKAAAPVPLTHAEVKASAAAERLVQGKSPVVANKAVAPSRIPSSLPKEIASSAIGKYTVQVGSYQTEKEAQAKSAGLKDKGFSAFYVSANVKGSTWYRVSVGLFTTQKEAEAYKKDLITRAKVDSALVQKVTSAD